MMLRTKRVLLPGETFYFVECSLIPPAVPTIVRLPGRRKTKPSPKRKARSRKVA